MAIASTPLRRLLGRSVLASFEEPPLQLSRKWPLSEFMVRVVPPGPEGDEERAGSSSCGGPMGAPGAPRPPDQARGGAPQGSGVSAPLTSEGGSKV